MLRKEFLNPDLKSSFRIGSKSFTRNRKLSFSTLLILIFQKSVKSLQLKLNEYFLVDTNDSGVTAGAYTQARAKLDHEVFIKLNRKVYTNYWYNDGDYEKYKGHRLLAIDGSNIRLPNNSQIKDEFGSIPINNGSNTGDYSGGRASVIYDVLNELVLDSSLASSNVSELSLALEHLEFCQKNDLVLLDRGYPSYRLFTTLYQKNLDFVCRCSRVAFREVKKFLKQKDVFDIEVTLTPRNGLRKQAKKEGFHVSNSITLRLVKVVLPKGEIEILATSLLDKSKYPLEDFKHLYNMRWGVETFFERLKGRLALENFTGKTVEAVKQDFYSTILVTNVESEIAGPINLELQQYPADTKYKYKVNKAVSFNAIKNHVVELMLCHELDFEELVERLQKVFRKNTVPIRPNRSFTRKRSTRKTLHFQRGAKKMVY